ncbi:MAG: hypothetical protein MZV70_73275 [Desulfobacterales bacterium]|nr:hypothetical protein [Desulfobacterales bacterium]
MNGRPGPGYGRSPAMIPRSVLPEDPEPYVRVSRCPRSLPGRCHLCPGHIRRQLR